MTKNISAFDYRVPDGMIAITFDVKGMNPETAAFPASEATSIEADINASQHPPYYETVALLGRNFRKIYKAKAKKAHRRTGIVCLAYWTCLNHPKIGDKFRKALSELLARDGKAHISWYLGKNKSFAFAVGPVFVDLGAATNAMPGSRVAISIGDPTPPETTH